MENIVIATIKSWNIENAHKFSKDCRDYNVFVITEKEKLEAVHGLNPRYIFFPHWSWKIPKEIYEKYECVAFHLADLPYGRGGSPLQNLILRKIYKTKISAFRVDEGIDTGPIYLKRPMDISTGSAQEIYQVVSRIIFEGMIPEILQKQMQPISQTGKVLEFKRRIPDESNAWPKDSFHNLEFTYDFIRMLDAEDYPKAFIRWFYNWKMLFSDAHFNGNKITGRFEIVKE